MILMALGFKIMIWVIAVIVIIYLLASLVIGIVCLRLMLAREKGSYVDSEKPEDFKIIGGEDNPMFPDIKKLKDQQYALKEILKNKEYEYLEIKSDRGIRLAGWYFKSGKQKDPNHPKILMCCHGWKSCGASDIATNALFYFDSEYDVFICDHQGHGHSDGKYLGFGVLDHLNMKKWIELIDKKYQGNCSIYLHGVSMGAYTLMLLNGCKLPPSVKGMVADCGPTSGYDEIKYLTKSYHANFLLVKQAIWLLCKMFYRYDLRLSAVDRLKNAQRPVLFIHGDKDNFVPISHTYKNYEACTAKKQLKVFEGATHAVSYIHYKEEYQKTVLDFFDSLEENYE